MRLLQLWPRRVCLIILFVAMPIAASAIGIADLRSELRELFPEATRYGALSGNPPATPIYKGDKLIGYAFLTKPVLAIPAYSGKPINNLVGFDLAGRIVGVRIVEHEEPILVVGVTEDDLRRFVDQYRNKLVDDHISVGGSMRKGDVVIDAITGASITAMVENATVMKSVQRVAAARGIGAAGNAVAPTPANTQEGSLLDPTPPTSEIVEQAQPESLWIMVWHQRVFHIVILSVGLVFLMLVLVFQDWLTRRPKLLWYVRNGYLLFTVLFIGWYALAQLSVFNVLTFIHAVLHEFRWDTFLINPLIFLLWGFVAVTLLLWGRGVFCGWLCPYGALQEFIQQLAQRLHLPQLEFPEVVHERLWAIKYIILLLLFGISLQSLGTAARYVEVEPFKTAITLHFQREWIFVAYAAGLLVVSAFNRKFYCKYLCALGAALAIGGRFAIFNWLRRHPECGRPCQICNQECPSRAIRETGEINESECHYCLDCQVTYWNVYRCPPMVSRLKRREPDARGLAKAFAGLETTSVKVSPPSPPSAK